MSYKKKSSGKEQVVSHKCKLMELPAEKFNGGTVRLGNKNAFPALKGMAAFFLTLDRDGLRIPHWHPNADELDYCIQGKARITIISPEHTVETVTLEPGEVTFIPKGYFHYIENIGDQEMKFLVVFSNEMPDDICVTEALGGIPADVLATALKIPEETVKQFSKDTDLVTSKFSTKTR